MKTKEQFINEVIGSSDQIKRQEIDQYTFEKLVDRTLSGSKEQVFSAGFTWKIAASIVLLIGLNLFTFFSFYGHSNNSKQGLKVFATEYFSYFNN